MSITSKPKQSSAYALMAHIWQCSLKATGHSWERLNHAMYDALKLAINAGLIFGPDDFAKIMHDFDGGYWILDGGGEWCYSMAVQTGNLSAAQAFEHWKKRKPFIADDVDYDAGDDRGKHGSYGRQRERLAVGFKFPWKEHKAKVTSFGDDGTYLMACTYRPRKEGEYTEKIARRFRITIADIRAERKERKERKALETRLGKMAEADSAVMEEFRSRTGIKNSNEYDVAPVDKLRAVIEEMEAERKAA